LPVSGEIAGGFGRRRRCIFVTTGRVSGYGNVCATGDVSDCDKIIYVRSRPPNKWDDRVGVAGCYWKAP
jgi:hypothetical protein